MQIIKIVNHGFIGNIFIVIYMFIVLMTKVNSESNNLSSFNSVFKPTLPIIRHKRGLAQNAN